MENIILTNNKDLRLVGVKVGVLSTLRFELPLVSASATHVEVIVTSGNVHSAYTATFIDATNRWQCDIAASQFPTVGRQSYEVAYVLDGKQFWDGKGWIEIEDATTSGIEPQPRPEPYRYAVVSVNGYGADAQGAVRIPKTVIATDSPTTTEGFMEGDTYFNRETGATWTLCNVQGTLTWVFNYKNYYTKAETEEAIDRVAAYYITYDAAGNPFPTYAALANATTVYSGGSVRIPTRNDYCVVLADEMHGGAEWRYIYAVAEGETTGSWQPQFPVEGVMTVDQTVIKNSVNSVAGGGVWSAIWGALAALPTGFASLYDWVVAQLAGKLDKSGGEMTGPITHLQISNDSNRYIGTEKIGLVPVGVGIRRKGEGNLGVVIRLRDGTDREASFYIDDDGKVYINTPNGYVEVPDATNGGTLALTAGTGHTGNLAALDANGNPTDSGIAKTAVAPLDSPAFSGTPTAPTPTAGDNSMKVATTAFVQGEGANKLNSTAAGPNFQTGVAYAVGKHVTYNGVLYECVVAIADSSTTPDQDIYDDSTTPATGHWKVTDMTDPDAVLDVTAQNQLRVVAKDGTLLWAQGYDLASTSSATLACDAVNNFTFADGATTQAFALPTSPSGKAGDFGLDIDNSANTGAATLTLTGLDTTFSVVVPEGESLTDMLAIAAGELARFYVTLTTFSVNSLPTWHIVKQVVENGGAQS